MFNEDGTISPENSSELVLGVNGKKKVILVDKNNINQVLVFKEIIKNS